MSSKAMIFKTLSGGMKCWNCDNTKEIKLIEKVYGGTVSRYKCLKCGVTWRYDRSSFPTPQEIKHDKKAKEYADPYRSFSRGLNN